MSSTSRGRSCCQACRTHTPTSVAWEKGVGLPFACFRVRRENVCCRLTDDPPECPFQNCRPCSTFVKCLSYKRFDRLRYVGVDIPGRAASVSRLRDLLEPLCSGGESLVRAYSHCICLLRMYFSLRHSFPFYRIFAPLTFVPRLFLSSMCGQCPLCGTERLPVRGGRTENHRATRREKSGSSVGGESCMQSASKVRTQARGVVRRTPGRML